MTEDYKERIIKYLTNNYNEEQESTTPFFVNDIELKTISENIYNYFDTIKGYIQGKDGKGNDLDLGFIYGIKNNKGVIAIVDNTFNVIQVITKYDSGTDFSEWLCLNIDITNGNIYGVDYKSSTARFILLNNFLIKTTTQTQYEVKLRNSYNIALPQNATESGVKYVEKRPNAAFYVIIGTRQDPNTSAIVPYTITYQINVGAQNEINYYYYTSGQSHDYTIKGYIIVWSGDTFVARIGAYKEISGDIFYTEFWYDDGTAGIVINYDIQLNYNYPLRIDLRITDIKITNNYSFVSYQLYNNVLNQLVGAVLAEIDYYSSEPVEIYNITYDEGLNYYDIGINLYKNKNILYFYSYKNINSPSQPSLAAYEVTFGLVDDERNILSTTTDNLEIYNILGLPLFNVISNYNMLIYNLVGSSTTSLQATQIFNENNYNFTDYQDYNSMLPTSGILYDENNKIIYARNLYNKTISGNTTTSTLEISNMLLNDVTISQQDLLGATNGILISNTDNITKNIYEELYINFINTISMQNRNTAEYVSNITGASRLNSSISHTIDYTDVTLNKIRINYADNTSYVKSINPASQISQFVYKYEFNIYVTKAITNIELISNDTNTTYQTIDASQLEINKAYKISQNVEIQ